MMYRPFAALALLHPLLPLLLASTSLLAAFEDHLIPEPEPFGKTDEYYQSLRVYFTDAFKAGVVLRAVVLPSFHREYVVGLKKTHDGYSVFYTEPTSMIWNFQILKMYENSSLATLENSAITNSNAPFEPIPLEQNKEYQKLKKSLPADFTKVPAEQASRPLDAPLAQRIEALWREMLTHAEKPKESNLGFDGITFHFSAETEDHPPLEALIWTPPDGSKCDTLARLAERMAQYSNQTCSEKDLAQSIDASEKIILPKKK